MWQLDTQRARVEVGSLVAELNLQHPQAGISVATDPPVPCSPARIASSTGLRLLRLRFPYEPSDQDLPLSDCYVRGSDLVATFGPTSIGQFNPQVYWREQQVAGWSGLELIVSLQTSLLDSRPAFSAQSDLPSDQVMLACGDTTVAVDPVRTDRLPLVREAHQPCRGVLVYLPELNRTLLEMVHPSDFYRLELTHQPGSVQIRWDLFPEHLEKGVIRRGRVRTGWLAGFPSPSHIQEVLDEFARSAPPLTA